MSASWTSFGRTQMLAALLTPDTYVAPTRFYLALCTLPPNVNDSGSSLVEPAESSGYSRIPVELGSANWITAGIGEFTNVNPFTAADDLGLDGGLCMGWAFCDAIGYGLGNCYAVGSLVEPFAMYAGQTMQFDNAVLGLYD